MKYRHWYVPIGHGMCAITNILQGMRHATSHSQLGRDFWG